MNQRVMIAMAIACNPLLLIADEPTTALDVTIQKQILDLLVSLQRERGMALVLITHDMGVVAETAHRVMVMYAGQMVEEAPTERLFAAPRHPYTAALLAALPERALDRQRLPTIPGVVPGIDDRPAGCVFHPRCGFATDALHRRSRLVITRGATGRVRCSLSVGGAGAMPTVDGGAGPAPLLPRRHRAVRAQGARCARSMACRSRCATARPWRVVGEFGLRQVDAGAHGDAAGAADGGRSADRRRADRAGERGRAPQAAAVGADGVPEPVRLAQSAQDGGRDPGGTAGDQPPRRPARRGRRRRAR